MDKEQVKKLQRDLKALGLYSDSIDGIWGRNSQIAWDALVASAPKVEMPMPSAWTARVSPEFARGVQTIASALKMPPAGPDWLMAAMAFETGRTFSPSVKNGAGSGATGLIQFMPTTAIGLGTTVDKLAAMSAEEQLAYVFDYFEPYVGRLHSLSDVYMAILWPKAVGKSENYVLWKKETSPKTYEQNKGLDTNKDGVITKAEAAGKVAAMLAEGLMPENKRA